MTVPTIEQLGVLADRVREFDAEDAARFDRAIEVLGHDAPSRCDLADEMRAYLAQERRNR